MVESKPIRETVHGPRGNEDHAPNQAPCVEDAVASTHSTKAPAFQFYPRDFLSSPKVDVMSMTERGVYITLLSRCWLDNGLPTDVAVLAKFVRMKTPQFERMWTNGPMHECFAERGGKLHNERLDKERKKQTDFRRRQQDAADMRWESHRNATASKRHMPEASQPDALLSASSFASASKKEKKESAEAETASTPKFLTFPTVGHPPFWDLVEGQVARWRELYPNVDVTTECRKALGWIESNPQKRKTARGMGAFLVNWLNNAVNRGNGQAARPVAGSRTSGNESELRAFANRGRTA